MCRYLFVHLLFLSEIRVIMCTAFYRTCSRVYNLQTKRQDDNSVTALSLKIRDRDGFMKSDKNFAYSNSRNAVMKTSDAENQPRDFLLIYRKTLIR